jgi:hypothetical protein
MSFQDTVVYFLADIETRLNSLNTTLQANVPINLDLGGALAAFGLIFTVYQLRKPSWEIVLRIRPRWQAELFWILGLVGLLFTLIRAVIANYLNFNYFSLEVMAYLAFILSPLSLIYFGRRSVKIFQKNTAQRFYEAAVRAIAKSSPEYTNSAIEIVLDNFIEICKAIKDKDNPTNKLARATLDVLLSDQAVVEILTTKRIDALQYILYQLEQNEITERHTYVGLDKIAESLFHNQNSFLYSQLDGKGLALPYNLYESLFRSPWLISNYDIFGTNVLGYSPSILNRKSLQVFIEALKNSLLAYFSGEQLSARNINNGLKALSSIFGEITRKIAKQEKGVSTRESMEEEWWMLWEIATFIGHDYHFLPTSYSKQTSDEVLAYENVPTKIGFDSDKISAAIGASIYKGLTHLSSIETTGDYYHTVLDLIHGIYLDGRISGGYVASLTAEIWDQIGRNVIKRHYPDILKPYLTFMGHGLADNARPRTGTGWMPTETERLRRLLYIDLKPLFEAKTEMVNGTLMIDELLPKTMRYEGGKFMYTYEFGKGSEVVIDEPPVGAESALKDVDTDSLSHLTGI